MSNDPSLLLGKISELLGGTIHSDQLRSALTDEQIEYLAKNWSALGDVELVWQAMDRDWAAIGAGYRAQDSAALSRFYASPVWLLNGIFTEKDAISAEHREVLAHYVSALKPDLVADFGGGFGSFSRKLAARAPGSKIRIVEPFPSDLARQLAQPVINLEYCDALPEDVDVVIAQDVLEHVTDPLGQFAQLLAAAKTNGLVITANCFQPVIKCHFPGAYHLHRTFKYIAPHLGCRFEGTLPDAPHIEIYRKTDAAPAWRTVRMLERTSRVLAPTLSIAAKVHQLILRK